ncbi:MAG: hypothetical protein SOY11_06265 [Prevotella sp.]|nr:hypothetical protein [Prevotella sp.]MDY4151156.1 hypothetical protein [Prevotella sp.]
MNTSVINEPKLVVTVSDPTMLTKLKNAIKMLNGVSSISILKPKKTGLELAEEDKAKGRVTRWNSVDEMFDAVLGE